MNIPDSRYFVVQAWMVTKLGLKSVERDVFAIIYGFSQDEESECMASLSYLSAITGYSRRSIIRAVQSLEDMDLITKYEHSVYAGNIEVRTKNTYVHNPTTVERMLTGDIVTPPRSDTSSLRGDIVTPPRSDIVTPSCSDLVSPHKNIKDNIKDSIKKAPEPVRETSKKHPRNFSNNVLEDVLDSQSEINSQLADKSAKKTVFEKCMDEVKVASYEFSDAEQKLLIGYLAWANQVKSDPTENAKRINTLQKWRKKLKDLVILRAKGQNVLEVVQQSIDKKWYMFAEIPVAKRNNRDYNEPTYMRLDKRRGTNNRRDKDDEEEVLYVF